MILIDTHVLIWLVVEPRKLGQRATDVLREAAVSKSLYLAAISAWEISMSVDKGRLKLAMLPGTGLNRRLSDRARLW